MAVQAQAFGNGRLPFDVLGLVFQNYFQEETCKYPLETLFLVCQPWLCAALDHKVLWSTFDITISCDEEFEFWKKTIPRRISRCVSNSTMDIDVTASSYPLPIDDIIAVLAGESGSNLRRWKRFSLDLEAIYSSERMAQWLSMPTPNLEDFEFDGHRFKSRNILPDAPLLRRLSVSFFTGSFPNLRNVTTILIAGGVTIDNEGILQAANVVTLGIEDCISGCRLSREFPLLRDFFLHGEPGSELLYGFSAPHLNRLSLRFATGAQFYYVGSHKGLFLQRLGWLGLGWWLFVGRNELPGIINSVRDIIDLAANIQMLVALNVGMARAILKLFEEEEYLINHRFTFRYDNHEMVFDHGTSRMIALSQFRRLAHLPEDVSWEAIYGDMDRYDIEIERGIARQFDNE